MNMLRASWADTGWWLVVGLGGSPDFFLTGLSWTIMRISVLVTTRVLFVPEAVQTKEHDRCQICYV
jgi:hypothetical protein